MQITTIGLDIAKNVFQVSNSKSSEFSGFPNHQKNDSPYG
jgi:hypothetical protein